MYRYASNDTTILRIKEMYVPLQFKYLMVHKKCNIMPKIMRSSCRHWKFFYDWTQKRGRKNYCFARSLSGQLIFFLHLQKLNMNFFVNFLFLFQKKTTFT